ncbi:AraC family transcriptional regulator [Pseudomonas sp. RIT-PI-AD]|uniref:AraC family transcriptional regulator n=1 Tax=Pseudomonas sp. RIT-PI-AD TaxID=3035294 RepID=UPI0021D81A09|nr:AraC family transcriptional regulator [Pseudomonas sp. RIT-PI-AD]
MREPSIAVHFVRAALHGVRRQGLDEASLLRLAGIPPGLLAEPRARVAPEAFARLLHLLWQRLADESLGLAPAPSRPGTFAMMCHALIHCRNLEKALLRGIQFQALFPRALLLELVREGDHACLRVEHSPATDPEHFLLESLLTLWHRLASWLIGERIRLDSAHFAYPEPAHAAEYRLLFPCPRHFASAQCALRFPARYLAMPLLQDERSLKRFLARAPADLLARPDAGDGFAVRIRRLLGRDCRHWPDLEGVARHLHVSPQTLRRHLREEGCSFQRLKDQLRRDLAIELLEREPSIPAIAERLGFSEASAFHRAFKKWTGVPPGTYRAREG